MSLTCHEETGRVGRVGRGRYEDASDLSATSRARRLEEFRERHDTRTNGQRDILVASSPGRRAYR